MFGAIKAGVKAIGTALNIAHWFQKRAERNEYRNAGKTEAERDQLEAAHEARERMDSTEPAGDAATRKRLRDGTF